jgi:hypothetical protein
MTKFTDWVYREEEPFIFYFILGFYSALFSSVFGLKGFITFVLEDTRINSYQPQHTNLPIFLHTNRPDTRTSLPNLYKPKTDTSDYGKEKEKKL